MGQGIKNRIRLFFKTDTAERMLFYSGLVALVFFWPAANIVLNNDSFRIIGQWTFAGLFLFIIFFFILPVIILLAGERLVGHRNPNLKMAFRCFWLVIGAMAFFSQLIEYHLNPFIKSTGLFGNSFRYCSLLLLGAIFVLAALRFRRFLSAFLKYFSLLSLFSLILLSFQLVSDTRYTLSLPPKENSIPLKTGDSPIYLLIFDGVSLTQLLNGREINEGLFPNFSRISKEWTWYPNATTNATSTVPVRSMLFSGQLYNRKLNLIRISDDNLLLRTNRPVSAHLFSSLRTTDERTISKQSGWSSLKAAFSRAIFLNKAVFAAYLEVSLPSPLRKYLWVTTLDSWRFDWRGEVPKEYQGREYLYYGSQFKNQFFSFLEEAGDPLEARGKFYVLWSMISHFPYIFDHQGNISESGEDKFLIGMSQGERDETRQKYLEVLRYVDSLLGLFIKKLQENGLYEDAIILVTSDHGINESGISSEIDDQALRIPFFLKTKHQPPGKNEREVEIIDIAPTILDLSGQPIPSDCDYDGQSLLGPFRDRERILYRLGEQGFWVLGRDGKWNHRR